MNRRHLYTVLRNHKWASAAMPIRYYLVTFDLINSAGRTGDYKLAEDTLKFRFGPTNFWKPLKQFCVVRTDQGAASVRNALGQRLGRNCNILVVALRRDFAHQIANSRKRRQADEFLNKLP